VRIFAETITWDKQAKDLATAVGKRGLISCPPAYEEARGSAAAAQKQLSRDVNTRLALSKNGSRFSWRESLERGKTLQHWRHATGTLAPQPRP